MPTRIELMQKIAEVDDLIASGVTTARDADGKSVTYRSLDDLKKMRDDLVGQLREKTGTRRRIGRCILVGRGL